MNIPDKQAVLTECFRVLAPGGRLIWTEVTAGSGPPHDPLPWAVRAEDSHLLTAEALRDRFIDAGFDIESVEDETDQHLELVSAMKASGRVPSPGQMQANQVVLGPDFVEHRMNYIRSLGQGLIASTLIVARKPG